MRDAEVRLDHAGAEPGRIRIRLQRLDFRQSRLCIGDAVGTVHLAGDQRNALALRQVELVQEFEVVGFVRGLDHAFRQFPRAFTPLEPVLGHRAECAVRLRDPADAGDFRRGVGVEAVNADHGADPAFQDRFDMCNQVRAPFLDQAQVLLGVSDIERGPRLDGGTAAVHLERPDGGDNHHGVGPESREAALEIPELLEADIRAESAFRDVVIGQFRADQVGDDRVLADGDIGEGTGVDEHGLPLDGLEQGGVERVHHPGGHRAIHLEVGRGDVLAGAALRHDDFPDPLAHVLETRGHGQNGHQLAAHGNHESGVHFQSVHLAALADGDVAQCLGAEVDDPFELHVGRIDIESLETAFRETRVVVVGFVLHPGGQRHHAQVVGVDDGVDVAGQAQRERGQGDALGETATGGAALDVERRSAAGLADGADGALTEETQAFNQPHGGRGLALAERRWRDGGHINVLARGLVLQALEHLHVVNLGELPPHGDDFIRQQTGLLGNLPDRLHRGFRNFGNLPVLEFGRVEFHCCTAFGWGLRLGLRLRFRIGSWGYLQISLSRGYWLLKPSRARYNP